MDTDQLLVTEAVVRTCRLQSQPFDVRLALYTNMLQATKSSGLEALVKIFPRDEAWAAACLTDSTAKRRGVEDAKEGLPWTWTCWQLRLADHLAGLAYEAGYTSVDRTVILGNALQRAGAFLRSPGGFSPLELARLLRVFSWQDEPVPKVLDQTVRGHLEANAAREMWKPFPTVRELLDAEASGQLYPDRA